jgi:hypothetical protein
MHFFRGITQQYKLQKILCSLHEVLWVRVICRIIWLSCLWIWKCVISVSQITLSRQFAEVSHSLWRSIKECSHCQGIRDTVLIQSYHRICSFRLYDLGILATIHFRIFCHPTSFNEVRIKMHKSIILSILYGFRTCSFFLREENRMRVFDSRDLMTWVPYEL